MAPEEVPPRTHRVYKLRTNHKRASYEDRPISSPESHNLTTTPTTQLNTPDIITTQEASPMDDGYDTEYNSANNISRNNPHTVDDLYDNKHIIPEPLSNTYNTTTDNLEDATLNHDDYNDILSFIPQPDSWIISRPTDTNLPHLLNFFRGNELVGVLPLTEDNADALVPTLQKYTSTPVENEPKKPLYLRAKQEWKDHKIIGSIAILIVGFALFEIIGSLVVNGIY